MVAHQQFDHTTGTMESRQPAVWAASVLTYAVALLAFFLRLYARRLKGVSLNFDDYLSIVAFVSVSNEWTSEQRDKLTVE